MVTAETHKDIKNSADPVDEIEIIKTDQAAELPERLRAGRDLIQQYVKQLSMQPGVYRMLNETGQVLYVGKAKNLKKRVSSYTQIHRLPNRLQRMVSETVAMDFITTHTEVEALTLEANLIKTLKPHFNILLRDDKSFPYILIAGDHPFPQLLKHRGTRRRPGKYFGPFASVDAVNKTLILLQKAFLLRNCSDAIFANRTRPCLQYQIKRCSAPCVDRISESGYADLIQETSKFLKGDNRVLQQALSDKMQTASDALDFEKAAQYRDRIKALSFVQQSQALPTDAVQEADIFACYRQGNHAVFEVFFIRGCRHFGNHSLFLPCAEEEQTEEIFAACLMQFYQSHPIPPLILIAEDLPDHELLAQSLASRREGKCELLHPKRGDRRKLTDHAFQNAQSALARHLSSKKSHRDMMQQLGEVVGVQQSIKRIEVYDNSHFQGKQALGAMIVLNEEGYDKKSYRLFNIKDLAAHQKGGDDYAMMREVFERRFSRLQKEDPDRQSGQWPDLILVDGGKGQLSAVQFILAHLGLDHLPIVGVAKGKDRNAGRETLYFQDRPPLLLPENNPVLAFIQRIRDESHRFAIGSHRRRRQAEQYKSPLDEIGGIGAKRKKALLHHFGSLAEVKRAAIEDLQKVDGIHKSVAQKIYDFFHDPIS